MTTRTLETTRQTTDVAPVSGLSSPFPVRLGGTEPVRTLKGERSTADVRAKTRDLTTVRP